MSHYKYMKYIDKLDLMDGFVVWHDLGSFLQ